MKISKGTVKNINKKLIASILAMSLTATLSGCSFIRDVNYSRDDDGYISGIDGVVFERNLYDCYFMKVQNNITDETYYTIGLLNYWDKSYYDIFTSQYLGKEEIFEIEKMDWIKDWINALGMSKDRYTEEELRNLLNIFIEKQEEKDKQLVKE